jgi:hypothetical protein
MNGGLVPLPPAVAKAISQVMAGVPKLERAERNEHGKYFFASIDDFLEAVRPLCAESGLIILQDEASSEILNGVDAYGKAKRWLSVTYSFTLAHSSGETWAHRPTRSIIVDASMGSQAYGAAQSYTLKLFERSLFQIATGEKGQDVDEHAPVDLPQNGQRKAQPARKSSAAAKRDKDWEKFEAALRDCQSARELEKLRAEYMSNVYPTWNRDWIDTAEQEFAKRLAEFSQPGSLKQTLQDSIDPSATDEQTTKFAECWEWLAGANSLTEIVSRADNPGYREGLKTLTTEQVAQLRALFKARREELGMAAA